MITYHKNGFSLLEITVALALSSFLLLVLLQVYLSVKTTALLQEGLARMQENGRYASFLLTQQIHQAGYAGCIQTGLSKPDNAIQIYSSSKPPDFLSGQNLVVNADILVIKTCEGRAEQQEFTTVAYYIAKTKQSNSSNLISTALYQKIINQPALEIIPGIENMRIRTDSETKDQAIAIRGVEIHLLLNSMQAVLPQPSTYQFLGNSFRSQDKLLRREWVIYAAARQRVLP